MEGKKREKRKEKKKTGIRMGPALLKGSCERGKEPTPWEDGEISGDRGKDKEKILKAAREKEL